MILLDLAQKSMELWILTFQMLFYLRLGFVYLGS